jgi:alanyl-tRNA synthetase
MQVDMQGFLREMEAHQQLSKKGAAFHQGVFASGPIAQLQDSHEPTEFTGYRTLESGARIVGIIRQDQLVDAARTGEDVVLVLDRTPAYGESGGQVGDRGWIKAAEGKRAGFEFHGVRREKGFSLHMGQVTEGSLSTGQAVTCRVDKEIRMATARNHTATHLLHHALRTILGEHATQSGSHVSAERLRFDFSNPTELSSEQLLRVEDLVNERILSNEPVTSTRMSLSEAREAGAIALFGETYGDIVRVISVGDYSRELCGGTHCERTGDVGLFKITHESSVAGGVRRIEAVTGLSVLERLRQRESENDALCRILNTQDRDLLQKTEETLAEIRRLQRELQQERERVARRAASGSLLDHAEQIGDICLVVSEMAGTHAELRSAADVLRQSNECMVCVLASTADGKVALVAGVSPDLISRGVSARQIAQEAAAVVGGGGGGRDDLAQAGGNDPEALQEAFERVREIVRDEASG